ncbi:hypothetical protein E2C01_001165 [Portunus trituberculatus]|uniref:Uncharacterized protein n=1 Tax=Portunus trituberculatus TaxID=210409 RepID=A0A5B7CGI3_PORTR|nr:hypothetical protein [Portunus trituberculatus]
MSVRVPVLYCILSRNGESFPLVRLWVRRLSVHRKGDSVGSVEDENSVIYSDHTLRLREFAVESLVVRGFFYA